MYENIRADIKVRLLSDEKFFGPGVCELLEEIGKCGSIQAACKEMGLSYSKGSHILKNLEKGLGIPMVQRWTGGSGGGGAELTEEARQMIRSYRSMVRDIESYAKEAYRKYFSDILGEWKE